MLLFRSSAAVLAGVDKVDVLAVGLEEVMHAVLAERVEIVVRVRRLQRRADGREARIADGRGRQALVHTQVVGRILIEVRLRERAGIVLAVRVAETVDDRCVDLELW